MSVRLTREHRRAQIDNAALALSVEGRLYDWTLADVADQVGISREGVRRYYTSTLALRAEVIAGAIERGDVDIVRQAIAKYDPLVDHIPDKLRRACARSMAR